MRRKTGSLVPLEVTILDIAQLLRPLGEGEVYGFKLAKLLEATDPNKTFVGQGTLYRALDRLTKREFLSRRWEDDEPAEREGRPRRRLYKITGTGEAALAEAQKSKVKATSVMRTEPAGL